jgi:RNA polymerase sigma factor (sigma-70 family)
VSSAEKIYLDYIEPIKDKMKRCVFRIIQDPDDAADAFQDALFKIWNYLDRIVEHPNPEAYILSICVTSSYDLLRKKVKIDSKERSLELELYQAHENTIAPGVSKEIVQLIQKGISQLSLKQAQAVYLRLFEEESYSTIGRVLNCTEETARSHVSKGLAYLRTILQRMSITPAEVLI